MMVIEGGMLQHPSPGRLRRYITIRRRRRKLKGRVYALGAVIIVGVAQYSGISMTFPPINYYSLIGNDTPAKFRDKAAVGNESPNRVFVHDEWGAPIVIRNSSSLVDFLSNAEPVTTSTTDSVNVETATRDRAPILEILKDAGVKVMSDAEILTLPTWNQVQELYGSEPVILGLDTCRTFQQQNMLPNQTRFVGVSGIFNSGTTAFGISLQSNCRFPHHPRNMTNPKLSDINGMLSQVPWAKHKMATEKDLNTIHDDIPKGHVLPVVLVRDPYFWMQSMCKQGYGVRWAHDSKIHCPNLVPNQFDRKRFRELRNSSSVKVWMGKDPQVGPSWPSLLHYYNAWYQSYVQADFPRLIIRFEDTLFHGGTVMKQVCECAGGEPVADRYRYFLDEAKWSHNHEQNNFVSAMIKYGTDAGRLHNMTQEDLDFARVNLDSALLDLFHYKLPWT